MYFTLHIIKKLLKQNKFIIATFGIAVLIANVFTPPSSKAQINLGDNPNFNPYGSGLKIIIVAPPGVFTLPGSATNITRVCSLGEAINLVLDVTGKNKIEFEGPIVDMCDNNTVKNLDQYIQLDKAGEITVRSDILSYLQNKSAKITMRNLPFEEEPDVEVDGKPAISKDIENKIWDQSSKTLTFKAKHFTTYKAVAKNSIPQIKERSTDSQQLPSSRYDYRTTYPRDIRNFSPIYIILIIIFIAVAVILIIVGAIYFIRWKRKDDNNVKYGL